MKDSFHTMRSTGTYAISTTLGESVRAFVPHPLPLRPARFVARGDTGVSLG